MPEAQVNRVRLYYEQRGEGATIACIHALGSSAMMWEDAAEELSRLGRVISYDRRGYGRSERPKRLEQMSVGENADDAASLLHALRGVPAVVIARSWGGAIALDLAIRYPERVRALVLLEPDASRELAPAAYKWLDGTVERLRAAAERDGVDAVGKALIEEILGESTWDTFPDQVQQMFTGNGPAILAELEGEWLQADAAALGAIEQPVLLVLSSDSGPELREPTEALAKVLPNARTAQVGGGHIIDPSGPEILAFVKEVLSAGDRASS